MSGRRWMRLRVKAEIWRRVAAGEPTREIAAAIGYSVRTVEEERTMRELLDLIDSGINLGRFNRTSQHLRERDLDPMAEVTADAAETGQAEVAAGEGAG